MLLLLQQQKQQICCCNSNETIIVFAIVTRVWTDTRVLGVEVGALTLVVDEAVGGAQV